MDDYLTKPVNPDDLDRILNLHAAREPMAPAASLACA
jgi:DNA-binding response OmpR family regulator